MSYETRRKKRSALAMESIRIALSNGGWFDLPSLGALGSVNKELRRLVRANHIWLPFLDPATTQQKLGFPLIYDDSDWDDPHIPPQHSAIMRFIPERPHGERRDAFSYYPHPNDVNARARGLFLAKRSLFPTKCFDLQTGVLLDRFETPDSQDVWLPRELPIHCDACGGVAFQTYPDLVAHIKTYAHQQTMSDPEERIPEDFMDPRKFDWFFSLDNFEKVRTLFQYKHRVIQALRAPLDAAGVQNMSLLHNRVLQRIDRDLTDFVDNEEELEEIHRRSTLARVTEVATDYVMKGFMTEGIVAYQCKNVVLHGWESFGRNDFSPFLSFFVDVILKDFYGFPL